MYTHVRPGAPRILQLFIARSTPHQPTMRQAVLFWEGFKTRFAGTRNDDLVQGLASGHVDYMDEYRLLPLIREVIDCSDEENVSAKKTLLEHGYPFTVQPLSFGHKRNELVMPDFSGGPAVMAYLLFRLTGHLPDASQALSLWDQVKLHLLPFNQYAVDWAQAWGATTHFDCAVSLDGKERISAVTESQDACLNALSGILIGKPWADPDKADSEDMCDFYGKIRQAMQDRRIDC